MQLHKSTVFVTLMDVKMPTIVGILTFMSLTSFMNVLRLICHADSINCWYFNIYEHDQCHESFKIDLIAHAINTKSRLKNLLQTFKLCNFIKVPPLSC